MKLTAEFERAKAKVDRQEDAMNKILDTALNQNMLDKGTVSDIYLQEHLQNIADLYMRIYGQTDLLYTVPVTNSSKSYITMHAAALKEIHPDVLNQVELLEKNSEQQLLDDDHRLVVAKLIIGFNKLIENHNQLIVDFANMVKENPQFRRKQEPPQPM